MRGLSLFSGDLPVSKALVREWRLYSISFSSLPPIYDKTVSAVRPEVPAFAVADIRASREAAIGADTKCA